MCCVTIQIKCKTCITFLLLFGLGLGTWLGIWGIGYNIDQRESLSSTTCQLLSTNPIDVDGDIMYHNNWRYSYNNVTYTQTDKTQDQPSDYICCSPNADLYEIVPCVSDYVTQIVLCIVVGWLSCWFILVIMHIDRKKYEKNKSNKKNKSNTDVEMADISNAV